MRGVREDDEEASVFVGFRSVEPVPPKEPFRLPAGLGFWKANNTGPFGVTYAAVIERGSLVRFR
jgi:hypothetical protein